jgi:LysM repeat protein
MRIAIALVLAATVALVGLVPTGTALAAPLEQQPPPFLGYHTVQPGDTLFAIGRAYGVDPWTIAYQNHIVNVNYIVPGQVLAVPNAPAYLPPGPTSQPQFPPQQVTPGGCPIAHYVLPGETVFGIAARYGVSPAAIATCNGLWDWNHIHAYSVLWLP